MEEREIVLGQQLIDRQYRLIAELEQDSRDATQALTLLMHGGSGKQARAAIDGLQADVVTLALQGRKRGDGILRILAGQR